MNKKKRKKITCIIYRTMAKDRHALQRRIGINIHRVAKFRWHAYKIKLFRYKNTKFEFIEQIGLTEMDRIF